MEKTSSVEDRMKRAEEIYQRRRAQNIRMASNTVNIGNSPDFSLFKRTLIKIFCCAVLYFLLYFIKNANYFFSNDLINKTNEILSYDMNLQGIYNDASKYLGDLFYNFQNLENEKQGENSEETENKNVEVMENKDVNENENNSSSEENKNNNNQNETVQENNQVVENNTDSSQENEDNKQNEQNKNELSSEQNQADLGIGGADEAINNNEEQINQMDIDAKYIKENFKIELPLKGIVTSRFGLRNPTNIISANHAGVDIGASEGTKIKAAIDGKVILVSSVGDYRKSFGNK